MLHRNKMLLDVLEPRTFGGVGGVVVSAYNPGVVT